MSLQQNLLTQLNTLFITSIKTILNCKRLLTGSTNLIIYLLLIATSTGSFAQTATSGDRPGVSPWGTTDQIGRLNLMSESRNLTLFSKIAAGKVYDLGVEYFIGMPAFTALGDPPY